MHNCNKRSIATWLLNSGVAHHQHFGGKSIFNNSAHALLKIQNNCCNGKNNGSRLFTMSTSANSFSTSNNNVFCPPQQEQVSVQQGEATSIGGIDQSAMSFQRDVDMMPQTQQFSQSLAEVFGQIEELVNSQKLEAAEKLFEFFIEQEQNQNLLQPKLFGLMIKAYADAGLIAKAEHVFQLQHAKKIPITARNLTPLLRAYSIRKRPQDARALLQHLIDNKRRITIYAVNATLLGYALTGRLQVGEAFLEEMITAFNLVPDVVTVSTLMNGALEQDNLERAYQYMRSYKSKYNIEFSSSMFNTLIKWHLKRGELDKIKDILYKQMPENHVQVDDQTVSEIVQSLVERNRIADADKVLKEFAPQAKCTIPFNSLLQGYMSIGDFNSAEMVIELMKSCYLEPTNDTHSIIINGYIKHNNMAKVLEYFETIPQRARNTGIYNCVLKAYIKLRATHEVLDFYSEMKKVEACDTVTYNTMLNFYVEHGFAKNAEALLAEMKSKNILDSTTRHVHVKQVVDADKAKDILTEQKSEFNGINGDRGLASYITNLLKKSQHEKVFEALVNYGKTSTKSATVFNVAFSHFVNNRQHNEANQVITLMNEHGVAFDGVTYAILINNMSLLGRATRALNQLEIMMKNNIPIEPKHVGAIIKGLNAKGEFFAAAQLFEKCVSMYNCTPNAFMCNTLLKGLMNQDETIPLAEAVIRQMDNLSIIGDAYTIHIVMLGYIRRKMYKKAREFSKRIESWCVGMNQYLVDVLIFLSDIENGTAAPAPKPSTGKPPLVYNSWREMKYKLRTEALQKQKAAESAEVKE